MTKIMKTVVTLGILLVMYGFVAAENRQNNSIIGQANDLASGPLPAPTGPFPVGRVTYDWVDPARQEPLAHRAEAHRELMVDVWYPAEVSTGSKRAPYVPDLVTFQKSLGEAGLKNAFGDQYPSIVSLQTHAVENAAFARSIKRSPVLVFSHGGGVFRAHYTAQLEDLASHGYVVAAIGHTYDTIITVFPDGRVAPFSKEGFPPDGASDDAFIRYQEERKVVLAQDIRFVIDQLGRYDKVLTLHAPFAGHLDLNRVGALGHSAGGEAAALACQTDDRIRACLNEDGVQNNLPFHRQSDGSTMKQPFLYFTRHRKPPPSDEELAKMKMIRPYFDDLIGLVDGNSPPSDEELARMKITRPEFNELVGLVDRKPPPSDEELAKMTLTRPEFNAVIFSVDKKQNDLLSSMPASYRATLSTCGVTHMSFSDLPLLEAGVDQTKYAYAFLTIKIVRAYSLAFFEKTLRAKATLLDEPPPRDWAVTIERFQAATKQDH
jgi:hypothetical protein